MRNKKVICAISGGIDSAVAAALLKRAGFNVQGVFIKFANNASFKDSEKSARKVAEKINIPFKVIDAQKEFKKKIIDPFLKEYSLGKTPNPCVNCNKEMKFGFIFKKFKRCFLATGHYVRIEKKKEYLLLKARDENKDQSYFLWKLSQKELKKTLFPLGHFTKEEIKTLAKEFKLPVLNRPESQEICFVPGEINDFLKKNLKSNLGNIIDEKGNILSKHKGLHFFTIGQRKGINLPGGPFYVLDKNIKKNILIVTKDERKLFKKEFKIKRINWISLKKPKSISNVSVKIRYRDKGNIADVLFFGNYAKVIFKKPQRALTSGQSAVIYKKDRLLGGGIIC